MKQAILKGQQLCKTFPDGNEILQSVDVEIYNRDFTIIMGASGAEIGRASCRERV